MNKTKCLSYSAYVPAFPDIKRTKENLVKETTFEMVINFTTYYGKDKVKIYREKGSQFVLVDFIELPGEEIIQRMGVDGILMDGVHKRKYQSGDIDFGNRQEKRRHIYCRSISGQIKYEYINKSKQIETSRQFDPESLTWHKKLNDYLITSFVFYDRLQQLD